MNDIARINFTRNRRQELNRLVEEAIRQRVFPGAEILVAKGEETLLHEAWGNIEVGPEAASLQPGTLFDIASLTKPVATASAIMVLLEKGFLSLEDKVIDFIPEFDSEEKSGVTIRHILTHTSGLPAWADLYSNSEGMTGALSKLVHIPLLHPTGTAMIYSDLGFLLLGEVIRRITGGTLADYFHQHFTHPLQMNQTLFKPLESDLKIPIAPTQYCPFRKTLLQGVVHDENAYVFNQEGGNAGLFSTASDLHRYCQMVLDGGELEGNRVLSSRSVEVMTKNHNPAKLPPRGLGWDIRGDGFGYTSCGGLMKIGSIGHTGFTGTSIWMEPETEFMVILLSNRVHIARDKNQPEMILFRPRLHNLLVSMFMD